jgi:hypothetical protein
MGIRLPNGLEFGLGPNIVLGNPSITGSVVLAIGKTFNYRGIGIPLNVALAAGKGGYAVSCLAGYAIVKRKKKVDPINTSAFSRANEIKVASQDLSNDSISVKSNPEMIDNEDSLKHWKANYVDSLQQSQDHDKRKHKLVGGIIASGAATVAAVFVCLLPR